MKVKANREVFIRANVPYQNDNNKKGLLFPGFEVEVIEKVEGQSIEGNNIWFQDNNGDYYWSGGFSMQQAEKRAIGSSTESLPAFLRLNYNSEYLALRRPLNYNNWLDIENSYKTRNNKEVYVAIIDKPINTGIKGLKGSFIQPSAYEKIYDDHGSFVAGLIGSNDPNGLIGISPTVKMIELPIFDNFGRPDFKTFKKLLPNFYKTTQNKTVIVNASFSIRNNDNIVDAISKLCEDYIVIAAAGEDEELESIASLQYPASHNNSISIGKVSKSYVSKGTYNNIIPEVDFIVPEFNFISYGRSTKGIQYKSGYGDSYSCAVITGVVAQLLASDSCELNLTSIKETLQKVCYSIEDGENFNNLRIVNPKTT